jgi:predicted nucleic acid-binding protein
LAKRIWAIAELGTLVRVDRQLGTEVAQLATEHGLSAYDAGYVAAARRLGVTLASCDERDLVRPGLAELPSTLIPR